MDVFEIGHQFGDYDYQLNDHNPGVSDGGIFWTVPIPNDSVSLDLVGEKAAFNLSDILMPDLHDLLTALWGGGAVDGQNKPLHPVFSSTVSLQAQWFNPGPIGLTRDPVNQFAYMHAQTQASIQWKSVRRDVMFQNDDGPQQVEYAAIGEESNGVFFS
jgi:hypothetical protein